MATQNDLQRLALGKVAGDPQADGAWWPPSRELGRELAGLFDEWPESMGVIARVLYSPPDWEDRPRWVAVSGKRMKTGHFPTDDTHKLVLSMLDASRCHIVVIPPATPASKAMHILNGVTPLRPMEPEARPQPHERP